MTSDYQDTLTAFLQKRGADSATIASVLEQVELLELPTRHILLNQGEQPSHCFFLFKGLCHACYLTEEQQFSKELYLEQDFIINFESLMTDSPSQYLLETLSPSQVVTLPLHLIEQWRQDRHPLYQGLLEQQLQYMHAKERFMLMHSPKQRFQLFIDNSPELIGYISDDQIASYLGISPMSLKQIKKDLAENK